MHLPHRLRLDTIPRAPRHGEPYAFVPPKWIRDQHEIALTLAWICHRKLWGQTYAALQPDFFWGMPQDGGVLLRPVATTSRIVAGAKRPGDIDLLVIPYHGRELILERTLAIEIKAIRASFAKQGKSPNDFGNTQAEGLTTLGFPYVALVHLIVSDDSPQHAWRMMGMAEILDSSGRARILSPAPHDMLPSDLMDRALGRLVANSKNPSHGLGAVYLNKWSAESKGFDLEGYWFPNCRRAERNEVVSYDLLHNVGQYYLRNASSFLVTPSHDPK